MTLLSRDAVVSFSVEQFAPRGYDAEASLRYLMICGPAFAETKAADPADLKNCHPVALASLSHCLAVNFNHLCRDIVRIA